MCSYIHFRSSLFLPPPGVTRSNQRATMPSKWGLPLFDLAPLLFGPQHYLLQLLSLLLLHGGS